VYGAGREGIARGVFEDPSPEKGVLQAIPTMRSPTKAFLAASALCATFSAYASVAQAQGAGDAPPDSRGNLLRYVKRVV
jgi:hypothetical protein